MWLKIGKMTFIKCFPRLGKSILQVLPKYILHLPSRCLLLLILEACLGMHVGCNFSINMLLGRQLLRSRLPVCHITVTVYTHNSRGLDSLPRSMDTNQVYRVAPTAYNNSLATSQAAGACQNWNGMQLPLPGSSVACTGEMEGFISMGRTDISLSSDYLARLPKQSTLGAFGQEFSGCSGGEAIVRQNYRCISFIVCVCCAK